MSLLLQYKTDCIEAGCDEAGRGCLAGPVVAAAVILPENFRHPVLNDSKQISEKMRYALREIILEQAVCWALGECSAEEIDRINILNASILAMHRAVEKLNIAPQHLAIDGNRFKKFRELPHQTIVKGDSKYLNIAAASILAKTFRDDLMKQHAATYPVYGWERNMGYPTKAHRQAILEHGITDLHRKSFRLLEEQMTLF